MEHTDDEIHVHCSCCSNKRLFDCGATAEGIIKIKCPYCRAVSVIDLRHVTETQRYLSYNKKVESCK